MKTQRAAAILTIRHPDNMSPKGKRAVAAWLRKQAAALVKDGHLYATRFTARYLY